MTRAQRLRRFFGDASAELPQSAFRKTVHCVAVASLVFGQIVFPITNAYAQQRVITDPNAPIQFRPNIGSSGNGTPQVDITAPSSGGISHNKFKQYDIDTRGVILNNAQNPGVSVIGGQVNANPNLAGSRPASIILNEVSGSTASSLAGPTEVFGSRANVIVANPNGVGCVGCTFINTGSVTLSTGVPRPDYAAGTIQYDVTRGTVSVSGAGLNAASGDTISGVTLVGRQISIDAPIVTQGLARLLAGAGTADTIAGTLSPIAGAVALTGPSINTSLAGTIRADSVSVLSSDLNIGVTMLGNIEALSGTTSITSAGDLILKSAEAYTNLTLQAAGQIAISGNQQAGGNFTVSGRDISIAADVGVMALASASLNATNTITSQATFNVAKDITFSSGGTMSLSNGALIAVNAITLTSAGDIITQSLGVYGAKVQAQATGLLSATATFFDSGSTLSVVGRDVTLGADTAYRAPGAIALTAANVFTNATYLDLRTATNVTVNFGQTLVNTATGTILDTKFDRSFVGGLVNAGVIYGTTDVAINAGTFDNQTSGIIYSPLITLAVVGLANNAGQIQADGHIGLTAGTLTNSGTFTSNTVLDITALNAIVNTGALQAANTVTLTAASTLNDVGGKLASGTVKLRGGSATSNGTIYAAGLVDVALSAGFTNAGTLTSDDLLLITASDVTNTATGVIRTLRSALTASNTLTNAGSLIATTYLQLAGAQIVNTGAAARMTSDTVVLQASNSFSNLSGAQILAGSAMSLQAGAIINSGTLSSGGTFWIGPVTVVSGTTSTVTAPLVSVTNSGAIIAANILTVSTQAFVSAASGSVRAVDIGITAGSADNAGQIAATGVVQLAISGALANAGAISGGSAVTLGGLTIANAATGSITGPNIWLTASSTVTNLGLVTANNQLTVAGSDVVNNGTLKGTLVFVDAVNAIANQAQGGIVASNTLQLLAGTKVTNDGSFKSSGALVIAGSLLTPATTTTPAIRASIDLTNTGSITSTGNTSIALGTGVLQNAVGASIATQDLTVAASAMTNAGTIIATANGYALDPSQPSLGTGLVSLAIANGFTNSGRLAASGDLSVNALTIANTASGTINGPNIWLTATNTTTNLGLVTATGQLTINSATVGKTVDNAGTLKGAKIFVNSRADITNRLGGGIVASNYLQLTSGTAVDNAGTLSSGGDLFADAVTALTTTGTVVANGTLQLTAATGRLINAGVVSGTDVALIATAGDIANSGSIYAVNSLLARAKSGTVTNSGNLIVTGAAGPGDLFIEALSTSNTGQVRAPNIWVDVAGMVANNGIMSASDTLQVRARDITNTGINGGTAVLEANTTILVAKGTLDSRVNSQITGAAILSIDAASLAGNSGLLTSTTPSTGLLTYGGSLYIVVANDTILLPTNFYVAGNLSLKMTGDIVNTGTVSAGGDLSLETTNGSVTNGVSPSAGGALIQSGGNLQLIATSNIVNNASRIWAGGNAYISAPGTIINLSANFNSTPAVGGNSAAILNDFLNNFAAPLLQGDLGVASSYSWSSSGLDEWSNGAAYGFAAVASRLTIQAQFAIANDPLGDKNWVAATGGAGSFRTAQRFGNFTWFFNDLSQTYSACCAEGGSYTQSFETDSVSWQSKLVDAWNSYAFTHGLGSQSTQIGSQSASIVSSGSLALVTGTLSNQGGQISATRNVDIRSNIVSNLSRVVADPGFALRLNSAGYAYVESTGSDSSTTTGGTITAGTVASIQATSSFTNTGNVTALAVSVSGGTVTNGYTGLATKAPTATPPLSVINLALILGFDPANPGAFSAKKPTAVSTQNFGAAGLSAKTLISRPAATNVTVLTPTPQTPSNAGAATEALGTRGTLFNDARIEVPQGGYPLTHSDVLAAAGTSIQGNIKFLVDPILEQQAIQTALVQQTGHQFLDPEYKTAAQQQAALYKGTVDFLKANPTVQLGSQLDDATRKAITKPILWYVTQRINGEDVLVPELILPEGNLAAYAANNQPGTINAIDSLKITATGAMTNSGTLEAGGALTIQAASFENKRQTYTEQENGVTVRRLDAVPVIAAKDISIETQGDLINYGGVISATHDVRLKSLHGSVENLAAAEDFTTVFTKKSFWGSDKTTISKATRYFPGQVLSGGTVEVLAPEGQVLNRGSTVAAAAGITVVAQSLVKQDVESSTYTNGGTVKCGLFGCNGSKTQSTITQRATMVSDTGGISITVKNGDYVQRGSSLEALNGTIAITAKNVTFETAAFEELNKSWNTSVSLTGVSSSTTKSNTWTVERPTVFANAIDIRASSNVTGTGAQIAAADSLTIKAGGDIDFKALQLSYYTETKGWSVGLTYPGSSLVNAIQNGDPLAASPLLASVKGLANAGANPIGGGLAALRIANALGSSSSLTQALDPTGGLLSGGGLSFGVSFSSFKSRSDWTQTLGSALSAGGTLTLTSGNDLTLSGSTATGGTTNVTVGGNLTVASVQDRSSSSSSSTGFSLSVGPSGPSFGVNGSKSQSNSVQTNALATITSTGGPTNVTVGGNTNLVGGAITSSSGPTNLTTGTLTASNLNDSKTSSSTSFGVTIGANPGLSFSQANATRLGLTFSVVGEGAITLTAPGADTSVLATLKRDASGRQIVTVDDHSGFSVDVSLSDFQALANVATSVGNFLSALTDPPPAEVAAGGSGAVKTWQTYVATGNTAANDAEAVVQTAKTMEALADAGAAYDGAPPTQVTQAIGLGLTVVLPGDQPTLNPPGALVPDLNGYEPAPTVVTVAASDVQGGVINAAADVTPPGALVCGTAIAACDGNDKVDLVYTPGLDPPAGVQTVASVTPTQVGGAALGFGGVALMTGEGTAVACAGSGGVACPVAAAGAGLFLLGAGAYYTIPDGTGAWASNQLTNAWNNASAAIAAMTGSGANPGTSTTPGNNYFETKDPTPNGEGDPTPPSLGKIALVTGVAGAYVASNIPVPNGGGAATDIPLTAPLPNDQIPNNGTTTAPTNNSPPVYTTVRGTTGDWNAFANNPQPNTIYQFDNGYKYQTDAQGRVANVEAALEYDPWARNTYQQGQAANCGSANDCGGHLIASIFGGPGEAINLVPMDATLNGSGGAWYQLEQSWLKALGDGKAVQVQITPAYGSSGARPVSFSVNYTIDGVLNVQTFANTATGR